MLRRVHIRGYKSLIDVEAQLRPVTVLFGPNAAGKSNFLDALQLLARMSTIPSLNYAFDSPYRGSPLESLSFPPGGIPELRKKERAAFSIEVDVELSDPVVQKVNQEIDDFTSGGKTPPTDGNQVVHIKERALRYRIEVDVAVKTGGLRVTDEYLTALDESGAPKGSPFVEVVYQGMSSDPTQRAQELKQAVNAGAIQVRREDKTDDRGGPIWSLVQRGLPRTVVSEMLHPATFPHLSALREEMVRWFFLHLEPHEKMRIRPALQEVEDIGPSGERIALFLNTLKENQPLRFEGLERALRLMIPSITGIDIEVNRQGEVELAIKEGDTLIPASVVSDGTLRILGLLCLPSSPNPPTLAAIEEPENGVQPGRVPLIGEFLKTRDILGDMQVIATTHSDILPDFLPLECLFACRRVRGQTRIDPVGLWGPLLFREGSDLQAEPPDGTPLLSERLRRGDFDA